MTLRSSLLGLLLSAAGCLDAAAAARTPLQLSSGCTPGCDLFEACIESDSGPQCSITCDYDSDCSSGCCAPTSGPRVCSPSACLSGTGGGSGGGGSSSTGGGGASAGGGSATNVCTYRNECLTVVETKRGSHCNDPTSMLVRISNTCSVPVHAMVCVETTSLCDCGSGTVQPGQPFSYWACMGTGAFALSAIETEDQFSSCHPRTCR